jgi:hypothetical protein
MLGLYGGEDLDVIFNTVIFISKWEIWKIRNKVKYNQSRIGDQTIFNTWKNNLKKIYNAHYGHHCRECMVVGFTTTYAISAYHH